MEDAAIVFMVPAILFILFVAPIWLVLHYRSKRQHGAALGEEIGRASCRERVFPVV